MKVLITNGSNPCTWYYGMTGKILPVSKLGRGHYEVPDNVVPKEDVFLPPYGVHVSDGELFYTEDEYDQINQELLQKQKEVKELVKLSNVLRGQAEEDQKDTKLAVANADRLTDEITTLKEKREYDDNRIEQLVKENIRLEKAMAKMIEGKELVELPFDVDAEIKKHYNNGKTIFEIISWIVSANGKKIVDGSPILRFANRYQRPFLRALANGYTVEKWTPEQKEIRRWYQGAVTRLADGRDSDEFCREAIEEVVHYLGGDDVLADISKFNENQLKRKSQ